MLLARQITNDDTFCVTNNSSSDTTFNREVCNIMDSQRSELCVTGNNGSISELDSSKQITKESNLLLSEPAHTDSKNSVIYRYKFTEDFMEELFNFSKVHQYDERKDFKEAWLQWTEDNSDIIEEEVSRLKRLGYDGDVLDKMFKSARYYFRKKSIEKIEPKQRRKYICVNKELLDAMDIHIEENMYNPDYQPKTGFIEFCEENENLIKEVTNKIMEASNILDVKLIDDKIKKTYKNRYFIATNK